MVRARVGNIIVGDIIPLCTSYQ